MPVNAKICGLTRPEDARLAVQHGAWRLGVVFAGGPRLVDEQISSSIVAAAAAVPVVGVFGAQPFREILRIVQATGLRGVQLDGNQTREDAQQLREAGLEVWRVVHLAAGVMTDALLAEQAAEADVVLLEPRHPDRSGGDRSVLNLAVAGEVRGRLAGQVVALAGGLTAESVSEAIQVVGPDAVDVSSGVEILPGIKDPVKLVRFLERVRDAHSPA